MFRLLLASALNYDKKHGAKHMVFFCEDQEQPDPFNSTLAFPKKETLELVTDDSEI